MGFSFTQQTFRRSAAFFLFLLFSLSAHYASAQNHEVRGTIYDKETGAAMIYVHVTLRGTGLGATSDENGIYSISKVPAGKYELYCYPLGYDSFVVTVDLTKEKKITQNIYVLKKDISLNEVQIVKERGQKETRVEISKISVSLEQIQSLPSVGGEPDLAQYLQILPGVVSTGDQGGQLYIRGGSQVQNKVLMDGMTIYNPFHSIGLFSVFDPDIIKNVNVYTGGFDASYGGRVSSVMDVSTKDGDQGRFGGVVSVSPFAAKLEIEGPIQKFSEEHGGSSFLLSARNSYLTETAPIFYNYAGTNGLPYDFLDLYGKLTFNAPGGSKFNIFGFNFSDNVRLPGGASYNWDSYGAGAKFILLPPSSSTVIEGHFDYSNYDIKQTDQDVNTRESSIGGFQGGLDFTYYPGKDMLKYGFEIDGYQTDYTYYSVSNRQLDEKSYPTDLSAYVVYNKVINRLILDPSMRLQYYASLNDFSFEPRMGAKFLITDKLRFKAAGGLYSQNLFSAQSDRDVVNLFYGFLTAPDELKTNEGVDATSKIEKSWDAIAGFEIDLSKHITLNIEGYYKDFTQLINTNPYKLFDDDPSIMQAPIYKNDYILESARAYGIDFLLTYDLNPFYLWITYSYSKVTHNDSIQTYSPNWDRTNNLNILATYRFGKKHGWEFSARFAYGSGFPFTQTQGYYENYPFQGGINTNYTKANGNLGIQYGPLDGGRLSDYNRLDVSLKRTMILKKHNILKITAAVTNVYDRANVFYFDRVNYVRVNQLPIMPSIAVNYSF